jgi:hypothetical protein
MQLPHRTRLLLLEAQLHLLALHVLAVLLLFRQLALQKQPLRVQILCSLSYVVMRFGVLLLLLLPLFSACACLFVHGILLLLSQQHLSLPQHLLVPFLLLHCLVLLLLLLLQQLLLEAQLHLLALRVLAVLLLFRQLALQKQPFFK